MKLAKTPNTIPATVHKFREDFDRLADRLFTSSFFSPAPRAFETLWAPNLDFSESEKEYIVRLEAPGIPKDDLYVNLDGQTLTISGERYFSNEEKTEEYFWQEREQGRFIRNVQLPAPVDAAKIEATYSNGIMTVRLSKKEPANKTRIPIK